MLQGRTGAGFPPSLLSFFVPSSPGFLILLQPPGPLLCCKHTNTGAASGSSPFLIPFPENLSLQFCMAALSLLKCHLFHEAFPDHPTRSTSPPPWLIPVVFIHLAFPKAPITYYQSTCLLVCSLSAYPLTETKVQEGRDLPYINDCCIPDFQMHA